MSLLDDSNREANAQHKVECHNTYMEHLAEMERKFFADEAAMHDTPIIVAYKERRSAQANQFKQVLLGKAQQ
jgi:hypothetical protein